MIKTGLKPLVDIMNAALFTGQDGKGLDWGGWGKKMTSWMDNGGGSGPKPPGI